MTTPLAERTDAQRSELALAAGSLAVVAWGFGPIIVRGISASTPTVVAYRLVLAIPVMLLVARLTGGRTTLRVLRLAVVPGVLFGVSMATSFASFQRTSIANATLITALTPVIVLAVAGPLFGEKVGGRRLLLSALSIVGIVIVVLGAGDASGASLDGDLFAVAALVVFAGYFLVVKQRRDGGVQSWAFLAGVIIVASAVVLPWALLVSDDLTAIGGTDWLLLVVMILGPGIVGHGLMTWSQRHLDVSVASLMTLGSPVISALAAWLVYDQRLRAVQVLGAAIVLASLGGVVLSARRPVPVVDDGLSGPGDRLLS